MIGSDFKPEVIGSNHEKASTSHTVFEIFSFSEEKIQKLHTASRRHIVDFHRRYLSRIYPKGSRVDSSNYDPMPAFNAGSQIIALNFQTTDFPLFLYISKFQKNGGLQSGYILKPDFLRHAHVEAV